jgi:hypothetical protein
MLGEVAAIAQVLPDERIALQCDVGQEVIAWEGYYEPGPVDFRKETVAELIAIGDGVPAAIELGYHLCYCSPADEHVIQPKDAGIIVEIVNAASAGVGRPIQFFHLPCLNRSFYFKKTHVIDARAKIPAGRGGLLATAWSDRHRAGGRLALGAGSGWPPG